MRLGLNFYESVDRLFERGLEIPAIPYPALWRTAWRHLIESLVLPGAGLLLLHGATPEDLPRVLRDHGVKLRESLRRDSEHGLAVFLLLSIVYVGALTLLYSTAPVWLVNNDESRVWAEITIPLILVLSAVAGVSEEFLFRGVLLTALARRMPWAAAAVAQAVVFGLAHAGYGTWAHVVGPALFGLGLAVVARTLGLVPAILLHAQINVVFFSLELAGTNRAALALVVALLVLNGWAAWRTRLSGIGSLWRGLREIVAGPA